MKKLFLFLLLLGFILTSCLEAEVDIDLKRDGTGEIRMKILPLESSMNFVINEVEADLRKKQNFKDSDIKRGKESDGRSSLYVKKKFSRVEEVDKSFKFSSKEDSCEFQMVIPREEHEIVRKVTVNMPGQIIESNIKGFSGNSLVWNRTVSSGNKLFVKSKATEPVNKFMIVFVILCIIVGVALFIFKMTRRQKVTVSDFSFCTECGIKVQPEDKFCPECGKRLS